MKNYLLKLKDKTYLFLLSYSVFLTVFYLALVTVFSKGDLKKEERTLRAKITREIKIRSDLEKKIEFHKKNVYATFVGKMRRGKGYSKNGFKRVKKLYSHYWRGDIFTAQINKNLFQ